jgi:hypothetical protein
MHTLQVLLSVNVSCCRYPYIPLRNEARRQQTPFDDVIDRLVWAGQVS